MLKKNNHFIPFLNLILYVINIFSIYLHYLILKYHKLLSVSME